MLCCGVRRALGASLVSSAGSEPHRLSPTAVCWPAHRMERTGQNPHVLPPTHPRALMHGWKCKSVLLHTLCVYSQSITKSFAETTFCSYNIFLRSDLCL